MRARHAIPTPRVGFRLLGRGVKRPSVAPRRSGAVQRHHAPSAHLQRPGVPNSACPVDVSALLPRCTLPVSPIADRATTSFSRQSHTQNPMNPSRLQPRNVTVHRAVRRRSRQVRARRRGAQDDPPPPAGVQRRPGGGQTGRCLARRGRRRRRREPFPTRRAPGVRGRGAHFAADHVAVSACRTLYHAPQWHAGIAFAARHFDVGRGGVAARLRVAAEPRERGPTRWMGQFVVAPSAHNG